MRIILHRGADEIGGSCVEISTESTRLLVDLGQPLSKENVVLGSNIKSVDAVLISHPHMDHFGLLEQIPDDVPVYIGELGLKFIQATRLFIEESLLTNNFQHFEKWRKFKIGDLEVTPFLMDHSAVDAYAFLIEHHGKRVFYSGDFRGHGRKSVLFDTLTKHPVKDVDVMLMEGTMLGRLREKRPDEKHVEEEMLRVFAGGPDLSFLVCSSQNIDRLVSAFRACKRNGRILVLDIYTAWVLRLLRDTLKSGHTPDLDWDNIKVLSKGWTAGRQYGIVKKHRQLFQEFSQELYDNDNVMSPEDLKNGSKYLVKTSYAAPLIKQLKPDKTSIIYSMWEGYLTKKHNPSRYKDYEALMADPNIQFHKIHTSGHAVIEDLQKLAEAINPEKLIPIHTEHAHEYSKYFKNVTIINNGETLKV